MRSLAIVFVVLCGAGCSHPESRREPNRPPPILVEFLGGRAQGRPRFRRSTDSVYLSGTACANERIEVSWLSSYGRSSGSLARANVDPRRPPRKHIAIRWNVLLGSVSFLQLPSDVYFIPHQEFADFGIHPPGQIEPNVQIRTTASSTKSLLMDCRVSPLSLNQTLTFQFEQSEGWGLPWVNKAVVTPSNGHVFYGVSPVTWNGGIPTYTDIRLQPTPESANGGWQFFGCELTFAP